MDILRAARQYRMFSAGDRVLAAVSGGPDSIAMLHALYSRLTEFGIGCLHVAHFNHGIRGNASDEDERFTVQFARGLGLECVVGKADVPSIRKSRRSSLEEAARDARLEFLRRTATQLNCNRLALGHTADDRIESVLMNVLRGTGVHGLASIRPVCGDLVRPLICASRTEVEAYIAENRLPFRTDESNLSPEFTRNRVRHELIPLLETYNPQVRDALRRLSELSEMTSDLLASLARSADTAARFRGAIDAGIFCALPSALRYELVRLEVLRAKGDLKDIGLEQIARIVEWMERGISFVITLPPGNIYAQRRGNEFQVRRALPEQKRVSFSYPVAAPGITLIKEIGLTLTAGIAENPEPERLPPNQALIDVAAVSGALRVRSPLPGDRIIPFGMSGAKKLQDVFVDQKVPRAQRARTAVLVDDEKILWVVGVLRAEHGRVTPSTQKAFVIEAGAESLTEV